MKKMDHKNIVRFLDYYEWTQTPKNGVKKRLLCIVMEYCRGGTLEGFMNAHHAKARSHVVEAMAQKLGGQIKSALLHIRGKGIIHRDLKPDNIMLTKCYDSIRGLLKDHGDDTLKIIDFGESKFKRMQGGVTAMITHDRGAAWYRAPEVFKGDDDKSFYGSSGT